ncbi:MAG: glycosyltransferase family 39 protein [Bacteroidetes bacterium]|nr:glycosyltransferase family 39 protein [Bacteroidota bacterium]
MKKILSSNINVFHFFLALTLLFYGNSLVNGYSLDDMYVTVTNYPVKGNEKNYKPNNELVSQGVKAIPKIWRTHYGHGKGTNYDYRPLTVTMFAIEYSIWGQSPRIDHFINLLVYALVVFCLFLFIKKIMGENPYAQVFALVCGILFLAHPIHTEVVNNIKCRDELLVALFVFLSFLHFLRFVEEKKGQYALWCALFILLGFFSKVSAILALVLIPLIAVFYTKISKKQIAYVLGALALVYVSYLQVRKYMTSGEEEIRFDYHFENPLYGAHLPFIEKIPFALKSFGIYTKLLFFPHPLRYYYGYPLQTLHQNLFDVDVLIGIAFLFFSIWFCYKKKSKISLFSLLFFLLSMAAIVNLFKPLAGIVGERLCFIASAGFVMFIVSVLFSLYKTVPSKIALSDFFQKPMVYLTIVLFLFLLRDWQRNSNWKSELSLYENDQQYEPKSVGASNMLGNKYYEILNTGIGGGPQYTKQFLVDNILNCYQYALSNDSTIFSAFNNAGALIYSYKGQYQLAEKYFKLALRHSPRPYPQAHENLANYYRYIRNFKDAYINYRIATFQNPQQYNSYKALIEMLFEQKNYALALPLAKEAYANMPDNYLFTAQYGNCLMLTGDTLQGIKHLEQAFTLSPNKELAQYLFGKLLEVKDSTRALYYRDQYAMLPK